ncbi:DUF3575 domain-containing protein [Polaribacter sp. R2A056_3_33]|jgi:hypothetical protein|uniref:DUF3575 domain-containing protein n=1 Tax=unclassified Polaribacter TaxID=196858 RepID=UPI001C4EF8CA|nr:MULTISPECIES: DUF3575 domain-containing protein [unclassified Polaribacter]QXP63329.1 DUF3575 domain-containing protein [Polaribacter sp. HaHaR_3_91]QXP71323.1 DUF3575 domain-containing protein [Polaribacter sp. R2A056_3_33]
MKKITLFLLLFTSAISIAQEKEEQHPQDINKKHEVKLNVLGALAFEWIDVSYEYLINDESSFGVGVLVGFDKNEDVDEYRKFSLTPFYRRYFSSKFARGFFVEGFGMLHSYENNNYDYYIDGYGNYNSSYNGDTKTEFAVGISVGGKFISKKGFTTEIYLGLGRNLGGDNSSLEAVGRGGISLGYRF